MGKRVYHVPYHLDARGIKGMTTDELKAILRGADELIMSGGRSLLAKLLKGSKEKKVLELGLDKCPAYGYFKDESLETVKAKIDWTIIHGYLDIEYDYRLPLLVFTPRGWEIEIETLTDEYIAQFDAMLENSEPPYLMTFLKDKNRPLILRLLEKVEESKNPKYIPILKDWEKIDYKKVRQRIRRVIKTLEQYQ